MAIALNKLQSLFIEQTNVNGSLLTVHYLVKNSPFKMDFLMDATAVEGLKLRLFTYDTNREVKLAKNEPLTFRVLPSSGRQMVTVEVRIQVLSSSMEGSLFVIVAEKAGDRVTTQPLKVVSKLEQVRAAIRRAGGSTFTEEASSDDDGTVDESSPLPNLKKRKVPVSDQVLHELEVIRKQQQEQFALLNALAKMHNASPSALHEIKQEQADPALSRPAKRRKLGEAEESKSATNFESALGAFLAAFAALPSEDRNTRVACFLSQPEMATSASAFASLVTETTGPAHTGAAGCTCSACPYRTQMNELFNQLLPTEDSSSTTPDFTPSGFGTSEELAAMEIVF